MSLYCYKTNQGRWPSRVSLRDTNYNSSKGPKHKHRVTEPPRALSTAQPSMPALGPRGAAQPPLQSSLWLGTSTPFRWLSLLWRSSPFSPQRGWELDRGWDWGFLGEKWDKFWEISSLSGNSSLTFWGFPSKDALLLHPLAVPSVPVVHTRKPGRRSLALLGSVPLPTSACHQRKEGSSVAREYGVCCRGRESRWNWANSQSCSCPEKPPPPSLMQIPCLCPEQKAR